MLKLQINEGPDPYSILQGKRDKVMDSLIKQMGDQPYFDFYIPRKGKYRIQPFKDQDDPHTRYFTHMIIAIPN